MTDTELQAWWPDLGTVVLELRRIHRSSEADLLVAAVRAGASSGEILGGVGVVLREHGALRSQLGEAGAAAWDAVMGDVDRAFPGPKWLRWLFLRKGRSTRRSQP